MPADLEDALDATDVFFVGPDVELRFLDEPEPRDVWCPVISVDDHLFESPSTFSRVPATHREAAPQWVEIEGRPAWQIGGKPFFFTGFDGAANRPVEQWRSMKMRLEDYRRSVWDPAARVADMDLNGVWAALCFPSVTWGFAGTTLAKLGDPELVLACVRSYNDWIVEEWCAAAPERYIACQIPHLLDPVAAAQEIYRNAERGVRAVSFVENPTTTLGFPSVHTDYWDPFFAACADTGTVVNLHIGSSGKISCPSPDTPDPAQIALFPLNGMETVVDWIFSGVPERFPTLKVALSEAGVSWVPMIIERLHRAYRQRDAAPHAWRADQLHPVDVLHRNFWFTSIEDPSCFRQLDLIGEDNVMVEVDFPHTDSSWPDSQELFKSQMDFLPAETIAKLCYGNAAALYDHPAPPASMIQSSTLFGRSS